LARSNKPPATTRIPTIPEGSGTFLGSPTGVTGPIRVVEGTRAVVEMSPQEVVKGMIIAEIIRAERRLFFIYFCLLGR
jgi:hypothetical protein